MKAEYESCKKINYVIRKVDKNITCDYFFIFVYSSVSIQLLE